MSASPVWVLVRSATAEPAVAASAAVSRSCRASSMLAPSEMLPVKVPSPVCFQQHQSVIRSSTLPSISVTQRKQPWFQGSFQGLNSSLNGAAVSDGATGEGTQVAAVLSNTSQGDNVIDVIFVIIMRFVIVVTKFESHRWLPQSRSACRASWGAVDQVVDGSRTVGALSLDCGFECLRSSFNGLIICNRGTCECTQIGCRCHITQKIGNGNFLTEQEEPLS